MKSTNATPIDFSHPVSRATVLALLSTALRVKEYRFARQTALAWLAVFPGDLRVNLILAQTLLGEGKYSQTAPIIENLCQKDPEFILAQRIRLTPEVVKDAELRKIAQACLYALGSEEKINYQLPDWARTTRTARQALQAGDFAKAENFIHQALGIDPPTPIPAILHVQITEAAADKQAARNLADVYFARWPECIQFKLFVAEGKIEAGDEAGAVSLLHQCVAHDAAGQVPSRLWGPDHKYRPLWPARMEIEMDFPVPAAVAGPMGWNQLGQGPLPEVETEEVEIETPVVPAPTQATAPTAAKTISEKGLADTLRAIRAEFERLARRLRRPEYAQADGRYPVYVVFSTRKGLEDQYGPQTAKVIDDELKRLVQAVSKRPKWTSLLFYADDAACTTALGVKPAASNDPWKLKLALTDLDTALAKKGEMIGALLIVGGPQVVPFHRLPNPTDDGDADVASDNPYASLDNNYFIPEWPIGRLPGGTGSDAGMLLEALRKLTSSHTQKTGPASWFRRSKLFRSLKKQMKALTSGQKGALRPSLGYSAAVWKQSSQAVYRSIGDPQSLLTSPPVVSGTLIGTRMVPAELSYFNLHGVQDGPDWYGQRDVNDPAGVDYPVALSPRDILNSGKAPKFVFSEACYGTNIVDKAEDQAISLKFISAGSSGMVGSTCISYGSVTTPLIAADLLGYSFWNNLREGATAGEALKQAKIALVSEMKKRQGFLDGEDQKTLISFLLYGDPLATIEETAAKAKTVVRQKAIADVKAISDHDGVEIANPVSADVVKMVKEAVDQYLPGLRDAELSIHTQQGLALAGKPTKNNAKAGQSRTVVTLTKSVEAARHIHRQYARMTLDPRGKVIKLSMSR